MHTEEDMMKKTIGFLLVCMLVIASMILSNFEGFIVEGQESEG